jgi:peptidoglycan/xylan/chitin deacetylase (PgdA/CDA1 family)
VRKAGYKALTVSELAQIARGRRKMPARPILITFDDARRDSFDLADPVLRRLGLKATMFVPTSRIHDDGPFFADWATIRKYAKTGRWDMQSHGHMAHDPIVVDAAGDRGMFLTNREWRPELERLETFEEYRERIAHDYARSVQLLKDHVPGVHVTGFAYPYSEAGQQTIANEPRALEVNREIADRYFRFGFVQDETGYTRWDGQPSSGMRFLWRLTVPRGWSGQRLLQHLAEEEPVNRAQAEMALLLARMDHIDAARTVWRDAMHEEPLLRARGEYQLALLSSQQGDYRMAERHLQAARDMGVEVRPTMQASVDKIDWESGVRVIPRVRSIRESGDRTTSQQMVEVRAQVGENWDLSARGGQVRYVQGARSAEG